MKLRVNQCIHGILPKTRAPCLELYYNRISDNPCFTDLFFLDFIVTEQLFYEINK